MATLELILVLGMVIGLLAIPGIFSSIVDGSPPRAATVAVVISGGMIIYAVTQTPGGIALRDVPTIVFRVIGSII